MDDNVQFPLQDKTQDQTGQQMPSAPTAPASPTMQQSVGPVQTVQPAPPVQPARSSVSPVQQAVPPSQPSTPPAQVQQSVGQMPLQGSFSPQPPFQPQQPFDRAQGIQPTGSTQGLPLSAPVQNPSQFNQNQGASSISSQAPQLLPNVQSSPRPVIPSQPMGQTPISPGQPMAQSPAPVQPPSLETPRITVQDLYGPSPTSSQPPQPVAPPQPAVPPEPIMSPQPSIPESSSPQPEEEEGRLASSENTSDTEKGHHDAPPTDEGGGFHFPSILMKALGGLVVALIAVVIISFVASFFRGASSGGKVTLTYWGLWEDSNVFQSVISDFERQNPNITITYVKQDPNKYTERLLTRIQNGTGPDIFRFHDSWVTPLLSVLSPLPAAVLDKKQLDQNYFPIMSSDLVRNGAVYGLPLEIDDLVLYTNKDIFDHAGAKVPTTWDEFVTVAKGLTVKDSAGHIKTAGAAIGTYENVIHAPDIVSLLLLQNGANLRKLNGSQNATDALNFYTSFAKTDDRVWDNTLDNSLLAFSRGKVAMFFGYSYDYFAIKAAAPQLNFEIHPVPHLPGRDMSVASYWVEGVSSKSKHQKEAMLFMKYLSQKDVMAKLYTEEAKTRQFGEIYPRQDLANNLASDPVAATFVSQAGKAVSSFFVSDTNFDTFNGSLNRYLGNAVNGLLNDTSGDSAVETLAQGVSQIFNQYAGPSQ